MPTRSPAGRVVSTFDIPLTVLAHDHDYSDGFHQGSDTNDDNSKGDGRVRRKFSNSRSDECKRADPASGCHMARIAQRGYQRKKNYGKWDRDEEG